MILDTDRIQSDAEYRSDLRHRFITDKFFAAQVLGFNQFLEIRHRLAIDLYPTPNPNLSLREMSRKKRVLHLDPRRTFKTTIKRVARVQLICAYPKEVTMMNVSATQPLAEEVSLKTAQTFYQGQGDALTAVQLMFPELLTRKDPRRSPNEQRWVWNTPNRPKSGEGDLDATLAYTSPKSTQSGWHPNVLDFDDVEDTLNSGIGVPQETRQHVIDVCDQNENLLGEEDYMMIGGTRYHPWDYYGRCLQEAKDDPDNWSVLVRGAIIVKDGSRILPGEFPAEADCELVFPEMLSWKYLRGKFFKNYESAMCQLQNDPQGGAVPKFGEQWYSSALITPDRIPMVGHVGEVFTCWRMAYGGKKHMSQYAEGAAAKVIDGKVYVIDCWRTQRNPSGLAEMIVQQHKKHQADGLMILDTPGSHFMDALIRNEAARKNVSLRMHWPYWMEDDNERNSALEQLEPLGKVGRLLFSTAMTNGPECHKQFVHFGLVEENGIIECISKFADMVPMSQMRANMQEEEIEYQRRKRDDALVNSFLLQQGMPTVDDKARQQAAAHLAAMNATQNNGMPGMPGLPGGLDG